MRREKALRAGFTLVEMVVLVGIFGLVMLLTIPNFSDYLKSNRLATTTERMAADLKMARSLSIANGRVYRLVADAAGYTITDPLSGQVVCNRQYAGQVSLAMNTSVDFFPWGMADAAVLNLNNSTGGRTITVLPTGVVEMN